MTILEPHIDCTISTSYAQVAFPLDHDGMVRSSSSPAAPRGAGQAAVAPGQGPAGAHAAGEQGAHGEAGGLLDGSAEPVPGGGRAPEGDAGPVPDAGAQVQQGQEAHQGLPAEVSQPSIVELVVCRWC